MHWKLPNVKERIGCQSENKTTDAAKFIRIKTRIFLSNLGLARKRVTPKVMLHIYFHVNNTRSTITTMDRASFLLWNTILYTFNTKQCLLSFPRRLLHISESTITQLDSGYFYLQSNILSIGHNNRINIFAKLIDWSNLTSY